MKRTLIATVVTGIVGMGLAAGTGVTPRQEETVMDMLAIATAVEQYNVDHHAYPKAGSIEELVPLVQPMYIKIVPAWDSWDGHILFSSDGERYTIRSTGADRKPDTGKPAGAVSDPARDIVLSGGQFVQWPAGLDAKAYPLAQAS